MDRLAKKVLKRAIKKNAFIISAFSSEPLTIFVSGHKVIRSPTEAVYDSEGRKSARRYFSKKNRIHPADFDLVDFHALGRAMTGWPQMFRLFYTKHITGCCQVNHFRNAISEGAIPAACPCCGHQDETTSHVLVCEDPTRRKLYFESVEKLRQWLEGRQTDPRLTSMIVDYLRGRGTCSMSSCHVGRRSCRSRYHRLAIQVDRLGWQNFTEGRIPCSFERVQSRYYQKHDSRRSSAKWAAELVDQIFKLTHLQWKYRNSYLKFRARDGAETVEEYEDRMRRIEQTLELTDPEDLLEGDRHLVEAYSLEDLAAATSEERITWEESMRAARSVARHARIRQTMEEMDGVGQYEDYQTSHFYPRPKVRRRSPRTQSDSE